MDPNEVVGKPREYEAWLAPNWSDYKPATSKQPSGYTKVSVRETTYADGRVVTQVLDENRQPITSQVLDQTTDKDQEKRFKEAQDNAKPPGGITTRTVNGAVFTWNPETRAYDIPTGATPVTGAATRPPIPAGGTSATEGTPDPSKPGGWDNSRPRQVIKDKNGTVVWSEELSGSDLTAWRANQQANQTQTKREPIKERPGYSSVTTTTNGNTETHTEKDDAPGVAVQLPPGPGATKSAPVEGYPGYSLVTTTTPASGSTPEATETHYELNGQRVVAPPGKPDNKVEDIPINGVRYQRITSVRPDGTATVQILGPNGKPVAALPSEGAATVGGPALPEIVVGQSEQALRTYHAALWADPSLTPAEREKRFQEAVQTANVAVQEAATQQRDRESQRDAAYHTATAKLTYLQTGMSQALDFASKLNATLDPGSPLGGQAFAALMGLQLLQLGQSGINDLPSTAKPPTIAPADLTDPKALAEHRATIAAQAGQAAATTAGQPLPANGRPAPAQNAGGGPGEPPARGAVPAQPSPPPTAGEPGGPPLGTQSPVLGTPPAPGSDAHPAAPAPSPAPPMKQDIPGALPGASPIPSDQPAPDYGAGMPASPGGPPAGPTPGILPDPNAAPPTPPLPPGEVTMAPEQQYAPLADYRRMAPPTPDQPTGGAPGELPFAVRALKVEQTPPWQLSNDDLDWAHQNGLLDRALSVPGRAAA